MTDLKAERILDVTSASADEAVFSTDELVALCGPDLEGLALNAQEKKELIGAIQCIVENVLNAKYELHERPRYDRPA